MSVLGIHVCYSSAMTDYIRSPVFQIKCAQLVSFWFYFSVPEKWVQTPFHHFLKDWTFVKTLWPVAHNYNIIKCTLTVFLDWWEYHLSCAPHPPPNSTHSKVMGQKGLKLWVRIEIFVRGYNLVYPFFENLLVRPLQTSSYWVPNLYSVHLVCTHYNVF